MELLRLTPREREIVSLREEGYTRKAVARRLGISVKTVKTHLSHVSAKIDQNLYREESGRSKGDAIP